MYNKMISIFVPTFNRSSFIVRLIDWFESQSFMGQILIGDGSTDENETDVICDAVKKKRGRLSIKHYHLPGQTVGQTAEYILDKVDTDYCALLGDDDYFFSQALEDCVSFLRGHPDYVGVHGQALSVSVSRHHTGGTSVDALNWYPQTVLEQNHPDERLLALLSNYTVNIFSVMRSATSRKIFSGASLIPDKTFADELLACCSAAIEGKFAEIERFYLVRQIHPARILQASRHDWIAHANWSSAYGMFRGLLAERLACKKGISLNEAEKIIMLAFGAFLKSTLATVPSYLDVTTCTEAKKLVDRIDQHCPDYDDFMSAMNSLICHPYGSEICHLGRGGG